MIGVDTNVLARLFIDDGSPERRRVVSYFSAVRTELVFVSIIVLVELVWLLSSRYNFSKAAVLEVLSALLRNAGFVIEREDAVTEAVDRSRETGTGIADYLVATLGTEAGCSSTLTFDKDAAKSVPGMVLLK